MFGVLGLPIEIFTQYFIDGKHFLNHTSRYSIQYLVDMYHTCLFLEKAKPRLNLDFIEQLPQLCMKQSVHDTDFARAKLKPGYHFDRYVYYYPTFPQSWHTNPKQYAKHLCELQIGLQQLCKSLGINESTFVITTTDHKTIPLRHISKVFTKKSNRFSLPKITKKSNKQHLIALLGKYDRLLTTNLALGPDTIIKSIINFIRDWGLLHSLGDGNGRTSFILLYYLCYLYQITPPLFTSDPKALTTTSTDEAFKLFKQARENTERFLARPSNERERILTLGSIRVRDLRTKRGTIRLCNSIFVGRKPLEQIDIIRGLPKPFIKGA